MRRLLAVVGVAAVMLGSPAAADAQSEFTSFLNGASEVPANAEIGFGTATFDLEFSGSVVGLVYELSVFNVTQAFMAHIHCGAAGVNGPVVAWLAGPPAAPPTAGYSLNGIWTRAKMTEANIIPGTACGDTLLDVILAMLEGRTYVNVHTRPLPGGVIRGQILAVAPFTVP